MADDSVSISERLQEMLRMYVHLKIVGSLKNGYKTLKALRILRPDLAIVDIKSTGVNGFELLAEIKEEKSVRFIILSVCIPLFFQPVALLSGIFISLVKWIVFTRNGLLSGWSAGKKKIVESNWNTSDIMLIIK